MRKVNRREMVIGLAAASIVAPSMATPRAAAAQGSIPDGVFVQESNGKVWMTLKGQRVVVPIWQAGDADIAAIPDSGMWAVLSVNDAGAMVAGGRPAWYTEAAAPPRASVPAAATAPAAQPTTDGTLIIVEHTSYKARFGDSTRVIGVIENTGGSPIGVRTIAVSLLGDGGNTVGGGEAIYKPTMLEPGQRAGWLATISNAPAFKEVRVQVESGPAQTPYVQPLTHELRFEGVTAQPRRASSSAKIAGQIVNAGGTAVGKAVVIGAVYSAAGKLVEVNQSYAKLDSLGPGQSSPFEIDFVREEVTDPSKYELYSETRHER